MVSYDLDGSEAESDISSDWRVHNKSQGKESSSRNTLVRNDASRHEKIEALAEHNNRNFEAGVSNL